MALEWRVTTVAKREGDVGEFIDEPPDESGCWYAGAWTVMAWGGRHALYYDDFWFSERATVGKCMELAQRLQNVLDDGGEIRSHHEGAYIDGDTVHIVLDFGDIPIHREGVAALDAAIKEGSPALGVETLGYYHPLVHLCEACSKPAASFVRLYPEGEEKVWFCEKCRES